MSSDILGLYPSRKAADQAVKDLVKSGVPKDELTVKDYELEDHGSEDSASTDRQTLVIVTTTEPTERQKAYGVLAQSGAAHLSQKKTSSLASQTVPDPETTTAADESTSSGVL